MTEIDTESINRRLLAAEIGARSHPSRSREIIRQVRKRLKKGNQTMTETGTADSYRGHVKREFGCGHWILIPDDFGRWDLCPYCPGEFVREVTPDDSDFEEATWT